MIVESVFHSECYRELFFSFKEMYYYSFTSGNTLPCNSNMADCQMVLIFLL